MTAREPAWENAILVEGNEIFTLTDLSPDTAYTLRWKAPDRQYPDVEVRSCQLSWVFSQSVSLSSQQCNVLFVS